jgi:hypothetical protein
VRLHKTRAARLPGPRRARRREEPTTEAYEKGRGEERATQAAAEEQYPETAFYGQLGGALGRQLPRGSRARCRVPR